MITRLTAKRQREEEEMMNDDANKDESKQEEPPKKKRKISSSAQLSKLSEYECCICQELPQNQINQCSEGHLICSDCYSKIPDSKCPNCRRSIDMNHPIRNRNAEKTLSLRVICCDNDGCSRSIVFSKLKHHKEHECEFAATQCKYKDIGCEWKGIKKNVKDHEANCTSDRDKMLKLFYERQQLLEKEKRERAMLNRMIWNTEAMFEVQFIPDYDVDAFGDDIPIFDARRLSDECHFGRYGIAKMKWVIDLKCEMNEDGDYTMYSKIISSSGIGDLGIVINHDIDGFEDQISLISKLKSVDNKEWIAFDTILPNPIHKRRFCDELNIKVFAHFDYR